MQEKTLNYTYAVDPDSDTAAASILKFVGKHKKVLEIGAGPGSVTRVLQDLNQCNVTALEVYPEYIERLKEFCPEVIGADLNDPHWHKLFTENHKFDVVVAGDVLEHLYDPLTCLKNMTTLLNDSGSIVISLPHVGHAVISACLWDGDFEYGEWGLLDRTHIRFFGIKNIQKLIEDANLKIIDFSFIIRSPSLTEFAERWSRLPQELQTEIMANPFACVYQVVLKVVPDACEGKSLQLTQASSSLLKTPTQPKLIAFYLSQFHPIPENDEWWGKGFTEWTNVTKAEPLYDGHYQPHLPADFGFYDLRVRETRHEQIRLAKEFGIEGFCYHYYWFSGKRLLEKPFNDMLADPDSDMPFCICWANENWTRRWDAAENQILIAQNYTDEDDLNFIKDIIPVIQDSRYIQIDGAPFIIVYRPQQLPDPNKTVAIWREYARSVGIEKLHLCAALTHGNTDYTQFGFDSGIEFPPHNLEGVSTLNNELNFQNEFSGYAFSYESIAESYLARTYDDRVVFKTVFPSWDNTARCGNRSVLVTNSTPLNYEYWLDRTIKLTRKKYPNQESFVFINAWNEWAEGCHLEPDRKYGHQFLEATLRAASKSSNLKSFPDRIMSETDLDALISYQFKLRAAQERIGAMESSKFWKLRNTWFKIKSALGSVKSMGLF